MAENDNIVVVKEARDRSDAELRSLLDSKREELHQVRFKHALGQLDKTHSLKQLKRDISRLSTILSERKISSSKQAQE